LQQLENNGVQHQQKCARNYTPTLKHYSLDVLQESHQKLEAVGALLLPGFHKPKTNGSLSIDDFK
jgi:hypothetical protein